MDLVTRITEVREAVRSARSSGRRIGFVPTMGYLHEGHLTLMRRARQECDFVVVSIFVNPTQFGPTEDFARYPRDIQRDSALCDTVPVDLIFHPSVAEIYPERFRTSVSVSGLTEHLCGGSRPGHFTGVATVVAKLFNIVKPDAAYFGQKDAQQVAVIRQMAADLNMDLDVIPVATVREPDGLALSSRNTYLSAAERKAALVLFRSLQFAQRKVEQGERDMGRLATETRALITAEPLADLDYLSIVDDATLEPVDRLERKALLALAVRFGTTRLIDNTILEP